MRVLCLDDDYAIAQFLAAVVKIAGLEPLVETDAIRAVAAHLTDPRIACVLCDYHMDNLDGIEVLSAFQERRPEVRRVLITADPKDVRLSAALRSGVVEMLLEKPPRIADLRAAIAWLNRGGGA